MPEYIPQPPEQRYTPDNTKILRFDISEEEEQSLLMKSSTTIRVQSEKQPDIGLKLMLCCSHDNNAVIDKVTIVEEGVYDIEVSIISG